MIIVTVIAIVSVLLNGAVLYYFWKLSRLPLLRDKPTVSRTFQEMQKHIQLLDNQHTRLQHDIKRLDERIDGAITIVELIKYAGLPGEVGQNSFSLLLLNNNLHGLIITNIYTKDIARFSVKDITSGQASDKLLPEEEQLLAKVVKAHHA